MGRTAQMPGGNVYSRCISTVRAARVGGKHAQKIEPSRKLPVESGGLVTRMDYLYESSFMSWRQGTPVRQGNRHSASMSRGLAVSGHPLGKRPRRGATCSTISRRG